MGAGYGLKTVFGSIHVVEQLLFSMFSLILTFDFDLILGSFFNFCWVRIKVKKIVLGSTDVVEKLSFSMIPLTLTFDFDLILGSFFTFFGPQWAFFRIGVP